MAAQILKQTVRLPSRAIAVVERDGFRSTRRERNVTWLRCAIVQTLVPKFHPITLTCSRGLTVRPKKGQAKIDDSRTKEAEKNWEVRVLVVAHDSHRTVQ